MNDLLTWLIARFGEPSSFAGIAAMLVAAAHLTGSDASTVTQSVEYIGAGLVGLIAFVMHERTSK